jgi:hypothetical protein
MRGIRVRWRGDPILVKKLLFCNKFHDNQADVLSCRSIDEPNAHAKAGQFVSAIRQVTQAM